MRNQQRKIVVVCGPTAVGKSRIGIELALRFGGEIVSADSQQVWRGFDIGTAKPTQEDRTTVPHHLIDVAEPGEHFDAARFVTLADDAIENISAHGRVPFVVGGTGMYIKMLVHGICGAPPRDTGCRATLEREARTGGVPALHKRLQGVDPVSASGLHPSDRTRVIRALEIFHITGVPASEFRRRHGFTERRYNVLKIGLTIDRKELYRKIDERVDRMIENGLVDEVRSLLAKYAKECQPFSAVGYREVVAHLRGAMGLSDAVRLIKQYTRNFAKRQMTWFRTDNGIQWFTPSNLDAIIAVVSQFLG